VDENGEVIYGDMLLLVFGREILTRKPGATFIGEVKCSQLLYDELKRLGGNPVMYKTGHSLIKAKMKEEHAELAGEMSGHMFFADRYFGYDDAIYAACRLIEIVARSGQPPSAGPRLAAHQGGARRTSARAVPGRKRAPPGQLAPPVRDAGRAGRQGGAAAGRRGKTRRCKPTACDASGP